MQFANRAHHAIERGLQLRIGARDGAIPRSSGNAVCPARYFPTGAKSEIET